MIDSAWHHFDFIGASAVGDFKKHRQTIHAMAWYMDGVVGLMVAALKAKWMWENTLWVHQSDNGGPSFSEDAHSANNWPLKGSKTSNWQGGIRVNAFVSGGLIKAAAPVSGESESLSPYMRQTTSLDRSVAVCYRCGWKLSNNERCEQAMVGKKLTGLTHVCDWFATFCALAGVDKTDTRAALAGLPPVSTALPWPRCSFISSLSCSHRRRRRRRRDRWTA